MSNVLRTGPTTSVRDYLDTLTEQFNIYTTNLGTDQLDFNLIDVYRDMLFDNCLRVSFTTAEKALYNKNPKRLSHALWSTTDLYFVIMCMNNYAEYEDMDLSSINYVYVPNSTSLSFLMSVFKKMLNDNIPSFDPEE